MTSFGLLSSILNPKRITESSATLIDNIFSSLSSQNIAVIISDISDHFPVCSKFDVLSTHPSKSFVRGQHFLTKDEQLSNRSKIGSIMGICG